MLTREQAIDLLLNKPLKYAHMIGFTKMQELNEEWLKDMMPSKGKKDASLQAHRLSYKTTCVSITLARIIVLLPNKRTLFLRKTDSDVKEIIRQVEKILLDPHTQYLVQCIYGVSLKLSVSNMTEISTNLTTDIRGTSQLVGMGIGSSLTGKHFDYIFTDDISNINDRLSKAERERTKIAYQELQNIKNRDGRIYNTLTPWHPDDVASIMPKAKKYTCYETGLISDEEIADIKSKMIPSLFCANYELRHIASEDVIFANAKTGADPSLIEQAKYSHVDASYGGEDGTAFTIAKRQGDTLYVFGKLYHKHVEDCMDEIIKYKDGFMGNKIWCEDNGDKGYLAKEFKKKNQRAVTYHESMNKFLKITNYLKGEWDNIVFVKGTDEEYIQQILDYNENAEHDDAPDSLASICRLMYSKPSEETRRIPQIYDGKRRI
jgi:hypothetical protein